MNWYIITKRKLSGTETFKASVAKTLETLSAKFGHSSQNIFSAGATYFGAVGYDENPQLIIKSLVDYPDPESLQPVLEELAKDSRVFAIQADSAKEAIQQIYMAGAILAGERTSLNKLCEAETGQKPSGARPEIFPA